MSPQTLKDFLKQQPFKPFRSVQFDGTGYDIRHPNMLMVGLREAIVGLPAKTDPTMFERFVTVDLLHLLRAEPLAVKGKSNGVSKC